MGNEKQSLLSGLDSAFSAERKSLLSGLDSSLKDTGVAPDLSHKEYNPQTDVPFQTEGQEPYKGVAPKAVNDPTGTQGKMSPQPIPVESIPQLPNPKNKQVDYLKQHVIDLFKANPDKYVNADMRDAVYDRLQKKGGFSDEQMQQIRGKDVNVETPIMGNAPSSNPMGGAGMQQVPVGVNITRFNPLTDQEEPVHDKTEWATNPLMHVAKTATETFKAGWERTKQAQEVAKTEGQGAGRLVFLEGLGEMALGILAVTPAGAAFVEGIGAAEQVAPDATQAAMSPISSTINYIDKKASENLPKVFANYIKLAPESEGGKAAFAIGDFMVSAGLIGAGHKGISTLKSIKDIPLDNLYESYQEGITNLQKLTPEEVKQKVETYVEDNFDEAVKTYQESQTNLDLKSQATPEELKLADLEIAAQDPVVAPLVQPEIEKLNTEITKKAVDEAAKEVEIEQNKEQAAALKVSMEDAPEAAKPFIQEKINELEPNNSKNSSTSSSPEPVAEGEGATKSEGNGDLDKEYNKYQKQIYKLAEERDNVLTSHGDEFKNLSKKQRDEKLSEIKDKLNELNKKQSEILKEKKIIDARKNGYVELFDHYNTKHGSTNTIVYNINDGKIYERENIQRGNTKEITLDEAARLKFLKESKGYVNFSENESNRLKNEIQSEINNYEPIKEKPNEPIPNESPVDAGDSGLPKEEQVPISGEQNTETPTVKKGEVESGGEEEGAEKSDVIQNTLDNADYTKRRKDNVLVRLPIDLVLENQDPDYAVSRGKNEIGSRVDKAKKHLESNPKTLEASDIYIKDSGKYKGKIGFSDGRHRLIAAKELGATHAYFELPATKEQFDALNYLLSEFGNESGKSHDELTSTQGDYRIIQTSDNSFLVNNGNDIYTVKLNESGGFDNADYTKNGKKTKSDSQLNLAIQDHLQKVNPESNARNINRFIGRDKNKPIPTLDKVSKKEQKKIDDELELSATPEALKEGIKPKSNEKDSKSKGKKAEVLKAEPSTQPVSGEGGKPSIAEIKSKVIKKSTEAIKSAKEEGVRLKVQKDDLLNQIQRAIDVSEKNPDDIKALEKAGFEVAKTEKGNPQIVFDVEGDGVFKLSAGAPDLKMAYDEVKKHWEVKDNERKVEGLDKSKPKFNAGDTLPRKIESLNDAEQGLQDAQDNLETATKLKGNKQLIEHLKQELDDAKAYVSDMKKNEPFYNEVKKSGITQFQAEQLRNIGDLDKLKQMSSFDLKDALEENWLFKNQPEDVKKVLGFIRDLKESKVETPAPEEVKPEAPAEKGKAKQEVKEVSFIYEPTLEDIKQEAKDFKTENEKYFTKTGDLKSTAPQWAKDALTDIVLRANEAANKEGEYKRKLSDIKENRAELLKQLRKKTGGQLNLGVDPSNIPILIKIGITYLEEGVVHFKDFSKRLYDDMKKMGILFNRSDKDFQKDIADIYNKAKAERFKNLNPGVALSVQRKLYKLTEQKLKDAKRFTWDKFYKGWVHRMEDVSGNAKEALKNAGGMESVMLKDIANKSDSKAAIKIREFEDKIFKDLPEKDVADLGSIIQAKRTIQLDEIYDKRKQPRLNHEEGHTKEYYENVLKDLEVEDKARYDDLIKRADDYFNAMNEMLDAKRDNGLISKEAYEVLKEQSMYSPRMFLQHLNDLDTGLNSGRKVSVGNNGVKKLEEGSEGLLEKDPRFLLATTVSRAYNLMAKNDAAKALVKLAENNPDNGIVETRKIIGNTLNDAVQKDVNKIEESTGVTLTPSEIQVIRDEHIQKELDKKITAFEDKNNVSPTQLQIDAMKASAEKGENIYQDIPTGKDVISAFVDGQRKDLLASDEFVNEWITTDPAMSHAFSEAIQWLSGAKLLRFTATGANPLFAIANPPRDMAYMYLTTDTYSKVLPKFIGQIHKDMATVSKDAITRTGRFKEFMEEGGGIEYLTHQGRFDTTKGLNEGVSKFANITGYLGETSELLTRLAMRERGIKNKTEQFVKDNGREPNAKELKQIKIESTFDAIHQLDFSQGGDWAKAVNKFIPYFNATLQATRGFARAAKNNPKLFAQKAGQLMAVSGALTIYNLMQPGYDELSDDEKTRHYIFMLGGLYTTNENGEKEYLYLKIPKSQETQFVSAIAENVVEFSMTGEARPKQLMEGMQNTTPPIPFVTELPPVGEAIRTYMSNYDAFYKKKIWHGAEGLPPELEYNVTGWNKTPIAWKEFGEMTGLSPERLRGSSTKLIASTEKNPFFTIPGKAFSVAAEGMGAKERDVLNNSLVKNLDDVFGGVYGRFYSKTRPKQKTEKQKEEEQNDKAESKLRSDKLKLAGVYNQTYYDIFKSDKPLPEKKKEVIAKAEVAHKKVTIIEPVSGQYIEDEHGNYKQRDLTPEEIKGLNAARKQAIDKVFKIIDTTIDPNTQKVVPYKWSPKMFKLVMESALANASKQYISTLKNVTDEPNDTTEDESLLQNK